ncbi:MAG: hypothetical protein RLZ98_2229 [Pseudomonadota bacterium]|jgi:CO/xanthine dehydrogenase Mo-binding subunit
MGKHEKISASRRSFLKGAGAGMFVLSIGAPVTLEFVSSITNAYAQGAKPPLHPENLSSFIGIDAKGMVTAYFGKMDMGHGIETAIAQMVAEELDVDMKSTRVVMGDTALTVNQGGASGSTGIQRGGKQMRLAAAEARRVLVDMAAQKLGVAAGDLDVNNGVVTAKSDASKKTTYAELIGGQFFNVKLEWNKRIGNALVAKGKAKPKDPKDYKIVGKDVLREDVAPKAFGEALFNVDIKVDGMLHARMIRPPVAGATIVSVDESSIKDIPGAKVVREKELLAVVAEKEWYAIKAAEALKVTWSDVKPPFPNQSELYDFIRKAPVAKKQVDQDNGKFDEVFKTAAKVVEAEYEWPYQSHAGMAPGASVVQIKGDEATVWYGGQKPHYAQYGVAEILGMPKEKVHCIWVQGPGAYGRNDAGDASMDAAVLAKATGRPVRVQYTRQEGHGWDPKGPASIHRGRAALDANGNVIAYEFMSKGFSRLEVASNESKLKDTLAGHLLGAELKPTQAFRVPEESYAFDNKRMYWETILGAVARASPLRTSHLRDPVGPQIHFASESFIDEIAHAANIDPVQLRLKHLKDERDIAVVKAAAEKANWNWKPGPRGQQTGEVVTGRGFAYAQRSGSKVAIVADIEINKKSGRIWAKKFVVAHDCGQIINPRGLRECIEGNIVQGISRTLYEEVLFDNKMVTSLDWATYPILEIQDTPESIECVLIDLPNVPSSGAGEPSIRPLSAAIGNAIFDATGVRMRRVPFTPDEVKKALRNA